MSDTPSTKSGPLRVGELRPSQLQHTFGIGAIVDLAHLSVMVMGLDDWKRPFCREIVEDRLLAAVKEQLGEQVESLLAPPLPREQDGLFAADEDSAGVGVPVAAFPRYMRCPWCATLARLDSSLFALKPNPFRPGKTKYVHRNCARSPRPPAVLPARFLVACTNGHVDDFPWDHFVHRGQSCGTPMLELDRKSVV